MHNIHHPFGSEKNEIVKRRLEKKGIDFSYMNNDIDLSKNIVSRAEATEIVLDVMTKPDAEPMFRVYIDGTLAVDYVGTEKAKDLKDGAELLAKLNPGKTVTVRKDGSARNVYVFKVKP